MNSKIYKYLSEIEARKTWQTKLLVKPHISATRASHTATATPTTVIKSATPTATRGAKPNIICPWPGMKTATHSSWRHWRTISSSAAAAFASAIASATRAAPPITVVSVVRVIVEVWPTVVEALVLLHWILLVAKKVFVLLNRGAKLIRI